MDLEDTWPRQPQFRGNKTQNLATMVNKEDEEVVKEDDLEAVVVVDKDAEDVVYAVVTDVDHLATYKEVVQILDIQSIN